MSLKRKLAYAMCFAGLVACGQWEAKPAGRGGVQGASNGNSNASALNLQLKGVWLQDTCYTPTGGGDTTQAQLTFINGSDNSGTVQVTSFRFKDQAQCTAKNSNGTSNQGTFTYFIESGTYPANLYQMRYVDNLNKSTYGVVELGSSTLFSIVPATATSPLPASADRSIYIKK